MTAAARLAMLKFKSIADIDTDTVSSAIDYLTMGSSSRWTTMHQMEKKTGEERQKEKSDANKYNEIKHVSYVNTP